MGSRALSHALSGVLGSARTARALRRHRRQPVAHDDHARRPHLGRGGRRDLSRRRRLGTQLRGARNQPRQRRLRPARGVAVAIADLADRVGLGRHDDGGRPATRRQWHGRRLDGPGAAAMDRASGRFTPGPPSPCRLSRDRRGDSTSSASSAREARPGHRKARCWPPGRSRPGPAFTIRPRSGPCRSGKWQRELDFETRRHPISGPTSRPAAERDRACAGVCYTVVLPEARRSSP